MQDIFTLALTVEKQSFADLFPHPLLLAVNEAEQGLVSSGDELTTMAPRASAPRMHPVSGRPAIHLVKKTNPMVPHAIVVGRSTSCDIVIADPHMSKAHAMIQPFGGRWHVSDMGSRNGTGVNNARLEPRGPAMPVQFGDLVSFAFRVYYFLDADGVWERIRG